MINKKIGILIQKSSSIFTNGCFQQAYFTYKALKNTGYDVVFITGDNNYQTFEYPNIEIRYITASDGLDDLSMILFVSAFADDKNLLKIFKSKNIKVVNQIGGNYFILTQEKIIFNTHNKNNFFIANEYVDEVWLLPMYSFMKGYLEVLGNRPVKVVPYVWDTEIINEYCLEQKIDVRYNKNQDNSQITLIIMEPNMSIHKTCLVPLVISEGIYKKYKNRINKVLCFCKPNNENFEKFISNLEIMKEKKIDFYDRMIMPAVLNGMKDWNNQIILITHNILNNLNYLPMEFLYLGYPVIHNCEPYANIGYFYPNQDVQKGIELFEKIINEHNNNYDDDIKKINKKLSKFNPKSENNRVEYKNLLDNLIEKDSTISENKVKNNIITNKINFDDNISIKNFIQINR